MPCDGLPGCGGIKNRDTEPDAAGYREVLLHTLRPVQQTTWLQRIGFQSAQGSQNEIITSKYTLLTFLPINLFEQFSRVANLYFLLTSGLQLIPGLSPTSWFTTVFPLVVVLGVNAVKEGYDDYHRHKNDNEINSRTVLLLTRGGQETSTAWRDVMVGDVVKVLQDEEVPADLLFLSSSDEGAVGHVETANLDGETNLKLKVAVPQTSQVHSADQLLDFEARLLVRCERPSPRLYQFDGALVDRNDPDVPHLALTADNLVLRGCTLRKTNWLIGLVVSTGADTKIMQNRVISPRKITQLERHMNVLVVGMFGVMLFLSALLAAGDQIYTRLHSSGMWYLQYDGTWPELGQGFPGWIIQMLRFLILLNGMIPISLYVTLEMVKVLQCYIIYNTDRQMYHADSDTRFSCRTTTLNEDLGQVAYVLSDKTGTLTQNVMGFVWASIDTQLYGKQVTSDPKACTHIPDKTPHSVVLDQSLQAKLGSHFKSLAAPSPAQEQQQQQQRQRQPQEQQQQQQQQEAKGPLSSRPSTHAAAAGSAADPADPPDPAVVRYFINLAVCNTVVPQVLEDGSHVYQAASPDEEALVQGAAYAGYRLQARSTDKVEVRYHGQVWVYTVLVVLEFDSDRKRMSIICRCPDGKVRLFCKGADTMIMARVRPGQQVTASVRAHLEEMAKAGYRTLCIAEKVLEEPAWATWSAQYHAASVALEGREAKIAAAGERIEQDLDLVGASAVEDKLQDGVPEAIEALVASGIKVWVLTGDKVETAISIALSCRLFTEEMALVELRERDFDQALTRTQGTQGTAAPRQAGSSAAEPGGGGKAVTRVNSLQAESQVLAAKLEEVDAENLRLEYERAQSQAGGAKSSAEGGAVEGEAPSINKVGLVIEGGALALALKPEHQDTLMKLCNACKSVVCCRVSPMQKAAVTKLVQAKCGAITLGIGDGANDVGMIQAAHIGVGISGREGRAAVLASDFSFAQFRYVARLVLWHGRATYKRNLEVVLYSFYKNWAFNMTYVYFAFLTAFSSQPLYTTGLIATLNLCWASLPIIAYALFEQDVSNSTVMANPTLYAETMNANRKSFFISQAQWLGLATWHSLVVFFLPVYSMSSPDEQGLGDDWVAVGCGCYVALVLVLNLRLAMRSRYWTWINHLLIWLSISLFFPFLWLYGLVWPVAAVDGTADMSWVVRRIFASSRFWLAGVLLAPIMSLLLDFSLLSLRRHLKPQAFEVYQEVEHLQAFQRQAMQALQKDGHVVPGNSLRKEVVEMQATV